MLVAGELTLLDGDGAVLSPWQLRELERQPGTWRMDTQYQLSLTDAGARRIGQGKSLARL